MLFLKCRFAMPRGVSPCNVNPRRLIGQNHSEFVTFQIIFHHHNQKNILPQQIPALRQGLFRLHLCLSQYRNHLKVYYQNQKALEFLKFYSSSLMLSKLSSVSLPVRPERKSVKTITAVLVMSGSSFFTIQFLLLATASTDISSDKL